MKKWQLLAGSLSRGKKITQRNAALHEEMHRIATALKDWQKINGW